MTADKPLPPEAPPSPEPQPKTLPWVALLLGLGGVACCFAALLVWANPPEHPLWRETGAPLALLVSGLALLGSAAFPLVIRRLAARG